MPQAESPGGARLCEPATGETPVPLDQAQAALADLYRDQMGAYRKAVAGLYAIDIDAVSAVLRTGDRPGGLSGGA